MIYPSSTIVQGQAMGVFVTSILFYFYPSSTIVQGQAMGVFVASTLKSSKNKDWLASSQDNVSKWSVLFICQLLFQ